MNSISDMTIEGFLSKVASDAPSPGGGAVAALVVAQAAGLAAMAGRFSLGRGSIDTVAVTELVAAADRLRDVSAPLADEDASAYEGFLRAVRIPRDQDPAGRARAIREATDVAAEVPLATVEAAAEVVRLAERLVAEGNPNLRGDAAAAALLAAAAGTTAAIMVIENLAKMPDDPRIARATRAAASAQAGANRAVGHFPAVSAEVVS